MAYRKINYTPAALVRRKEYQRRYARARRQTPEGREYNRLAWAKYNAKISDDVKKERAKEKTFQWRLRQFGVSSKTVLALLNKGCAICGKTQIKGSQRRVLCIDHDHKTGKFRGILCSGCNTALGQFQDDPRILARAARYLRGE